jgi:hypothetical protein
MMQILGLALSCSILSFAWGVALSWALKRVNKREFKLWTLPLYVLLLMVVPAAAALKTGSLWKEGEAIAVLLISMVGAIAGEIRGLSRYSLDDH